jgi:hypothetical protein
MTMQMPGMIIANAGIPMKTTGNKIFLIPMIAEHISCNV